MYNLYYIKEQKTDRLYPSATLGNKHDDLERKVEERLSDAIRYNKSINNIKELITYFNDKNCK